MTAQLALADDGAADHRGGWRGMFGRKPEPHDMPRPPTGFAVTRAAPDDLWEADLLQTVTFAQPNETEMLAALRKKGLMRAEVIATQDGEVVGHLPICDLVAPAGWVTLLPAPTRRDVDALAVRREMMRTALRLMVEDGVQMVVATGDPDFYRSCGFLYGAGLMLETPFPAFTTGLFPVPPHTAVPTMPTEIVYPDAIRRA